MHPFAITADGSLYVDVGSATNACQIKNRTLKSPGAEVNIRGYLDLMLEGSFPEPALRVPAMARRRWFDGYVEQMAGEDP